MTEFMISQCAYCSGTGWKYIGNGVVRCHCEIGQRAVRAAAEHAQEPKRKGKRAEGQKQGKDD